MSFYDTKLALDLSMTGTLWVQEQHEDAWTLKLLEAATVAAPPVGKITDYGRENATLPQDLDFVLPIYRKP